MKLCAIFALDLAIALPLGQPAAHADDQGVKARTNSTTIQKRVDKKSPTTAIPANKTTKSARPDLVVSKIIFSPCSPKENQEITIWASWAAQGSAEKHGRS